MFEQIFYDLFNSIAEMSDEKLKEFEESYDNFAEAMLNNQELINETKKQMRLEGLSQDDIIARKEDLLISINALVKTVELSEKKKELFGKVMKVVEQIYDKSLEDFGRITLNIPVELCHPEAKLPTYAHDSDAGFDFYAVEDTIIAPKETKIIKTGLKMSVPTGYELQVRPRSGLSFKTKLRVANAPGTVDCGYCDEIGIIIENIGDTEMNIQKGDRVAQGVLNEVPKGIFNVVEDILKIPGANRNGGFGSTGK